MKQITAKTLRDAQWKLVYNYVGKNTGFSTYACDDIPGLTITHDKVGSKRTKTTYAVNGRKTDSPTRAVRYYNEHVKGKTGGPKPGEPSGRNAADGPKSAGSAQP